MKAIAFAVFFNITDWMASRLSHAEDLKRAAQSVMHFPSPSSDWSHGCLPESISGNDVPFFQSLPEYLP